MRRQEDWVRDDDSLDLRAESGGEERHVGVFDDDPRRVDLRAGLQEVDAAAGVAFLTILGNLSLILGRTLEWDPLKMEIVGDPEAHRMMSRPQRYPYCL